MGLSTAGSRAALIARLSEKLGMSAGVEDGERESEDEEKVEMEPDSMTMPQLKNHLKKLGLPVGGTVRIIGDGPWTQTPLCTILWMVMERDT